MSYSIVASFVYISFCFPSIFYDLAGESTFLSEEGVFAWEGDEYGSGDF